METTFPYFPLKYSIVFFIILLIACGPTIPSSIQQEISNLPDKIDYNIHVQPILSDRCFACHGNDKAKQKANLRLDQATAYEELTDSPGKFAIVPRNLNKSEVFHRIISDDSNQVMPPLETNLALSNYEKAILIKWIEDGAEYKPHWAFIKPKKEVLPTVTQEDWIENPIDYFILQQLEEKGWQPAAKAEKAMLLRRVFFDLTGLPPTLTEINTFLEDTSPNAYEKVVDSLLVSLQYGERMATVWLDVARFADTHGYTVDRFRDMSPWRDWVINAFNENMSYDQFTTWQLAGDLLPNANREQMIATSFNRNHQQNMEGGIVEEEFRVEYVADRTNTLGTAFLGLTMECAKCHDHKYDPISQKEYFQLFSFFNNVKEAGQISWNNAMPVPTILLTDEEQEATLAFINKKITKQEEQLATFETNLENEFTTWLEKKRMDESIKRPYPKGIVAHFKLENEQLINSLNTQQKGQMKQQHAATVPLNLTTGKNGKGIALDGDAWLDLGKVGLFDRMTPFSIGLWVHIPKALENGVIFHKGEGAALYNFRGYHVALKDNKLEILMAHTAPYNAIIKYASDLPRDKWVHVSLTYDGSSKAAGLKIYVNGEECPMKIEQDFLYKDIVFNFNNEPGLQIGARWRGVGLKDAIVDDILVFNRTLTPLEIKQFVHPEEVEKVFTKDIDDLSKDEKRYLKIYYVSTYSSQYQDLKNQLQKKRSTLNETAENIPELMVMQEMKQPRPSYILERGQYDAQGEAVYPNTPKSVLPMATHLPKNRLGLAQWLMDKDHPLTARVAVNRLWQQFFGDGLVKTSNDFGFQGGRPSHPQLLDWLAIDFQESGWDMKKMVKQIVLSATYQQSSKSDPRLFAADKENIWLARGPTQRLTAEMIRDNALAAAGLLVKEIGGKSVKPYQPLGLWRVNGGKYVEDTGKNLYRRSLYTLWKRSVPNPTQASFDAPDRSNCSVKRQKTSTPQQALIMLNDPTFTEAAKVMGEQISQYNNPSNGIANAFQKLTGRVPYHNELEALLDLQQTQYHKFKTEPAKSKGWLKSGAYTIKDNIEPAKLAANTVVASTIINTDATIVKR